MVPLTWTGYKRIRTRAVAVTYNFDPDRWFEIQHEALERRRDLGEITEGEYQAKLAELAEEHERMLERLDIRHDY
jgi:hypothetical protein